MGGILHILLKLTTHKKVEKKFVSIATEFDKD
jgi:hypothetical protein